MVLLSVQPLQQRLIATGDHASKEIHKVMAHALTQHFSATSSIVPVLVSSTTKPKKEIFKVQLLDDDAIVDSQTAAEANVDHKDEPETPVEVESGFSFMSDEAEEENKNGPLPSNPTRGRRGKKLLDIPDVAPRQARKSARGRVPNRKFVDEEAKKTEAPQVPVDSEIPVGSKTKKGRKATQDYADATVELAQAPVVKHDRRKYLEKADSQPLEEPKSVTGTTF